MNPTSGCPDANRLDDFAGGRLGQSAYRKLAAHLGACPICRKRVFGDGPTLHDGDPEGLRPAADATLDDGGETEAATRYDFELNKENRDSAIQLLFPGREGNRLGQWGVYEIQHELGRGGMGIVFKGFDHALRRAVAVKVMHPVHAVNERSRARFARESRAMAAISHPNIVAIHAVSEHEGFPYLVMEYVAGEGLDNRIRRRGSLSVLEVLRIGAQIADGLEAAHAQGTIHRDIKPSNIMLEAGVDRAKISDFGLARVILEDSDLTPTEHMLGTPSYMAPEQIMGKAVDARADLFSLGCVLFAMTAGRSPFAGKNVLEVSRRVCDEPPPRLDETAPDAPRPLVDLVARLLERDPSDRVQSAAEVAAELRRMLAEGGRANRGVLALLPTAAPPVRKRRPRPRLWALTGVLAIGVSAWALRSFRPQPSPVEPPTSLMASTERPTPFANFANLSVAISRAAPGSTIHLPPGEYEGRIRIGSNHARGLTIEADPGAVLRAPSDSIAALEIADAPGLVIRGLTIRCSSIHQHGVVFSGDAAGVRLEKVRIEQLPGARAAAVYATPGTRGTQHDPLTLRELDVEASGLGIVLGSGMSSQPVSSVRIEDSRIRGPGFLIVLETAVHDAVISGNILEGGESGLSLALNESPTPFNIEARNNTFLDCEAWVNLGYTAPEIRGLSIARNLILNCRSVATRSPDIAVVGPLWFHENLWRKPGLDVDGVARSVDEVPLLSEDPTSPDYLRPANPSSVAIQDPETGEAAFAGAVPPAPTVDAEKPNADSGS